MSTLIAPSAPKIFAILKDGYAELHQAASEPVAPQILVVADSTVAKAVGSELQSAGYGATIERAASVSALRALLKRNRWDALLLEYSKSALPTAQALPLAREHGDVPVILIADILAEAESINAMREGVRDYVLKENLA